MVPGTVDVGVVPVGVDSGPAVRGVIGVRGPPEEIGPLIVRGVGDPGAPVGVFSPGNESGVDRFRLRFPDPVMFGPVVLGPGVCGPVVLGAALLGEVVGDVVSRAAVTVGSVPVVVSTGRVVVSVVFGVTFDDVVVVVFGIVCV